jgi:hypothetical protein
VALLEQVIIQLHSSKKVNQPSLVALLDCLTLVMAPIAYLEGLIKLLKVPDNEIRQKVSRKANLESKSCLPQKYIFELFKKLHFSIYLVLATLFQIIFLLNQSSCNQRGTQSLTRRQHYSYFTTRALLYYITSNINSQKSVIFNMDSCNLYMGDVSDILNLTHWLHAQVLVLYTSRMKMQDEAGEHPHRSKKIEQKSTEKSILKREIELQGRMVSQISDILLAPTEDASSGVKIAAIEALEKCATRLAGTSRAASLVDILAAVVSVLDAKKKALCVTGVRCVGTLVSILGPRALPSLPGIMTQLLIMGRDAMVNPSYPGGTKESIATAGTDIIASVLKTLGVIVENLGAFLNPYLADLISFLVLQPTVIKAPDAKVTSNAVALRDLISAKIPVSILPNIGFSIFWFIPPLFLWYMMSFLRAGESHCEPLTVICLSQDFYYMMFDDYF